MNAICGTAQRGKGKGRGFGFPTANLSIALAPGVLYGVYAAMARCEDEGVWRRAIVNIGAHPTLPEGAPTVEAHILSYAGDLYGKRLCLRLGPYLRPEKRFDSVEALKAQVHRDIARVRDMPEACFQTAQ